MGARSHAYCYHHWPSDFFARNGVCANGCSYTNSTCCLLFIKSRDDRFFIKRRDDRCQAEQTDKAWGMAGEAALARAKKSRPSKAIYAASEPWDRYRRRHVRQGIRRWRIASCVCPQSPSSVLARASEPCARARRSSKRQRRYRGGASSGDVSRAPSHVALCNTVVLPTWEYCGGRRPGTRRFARVSAGQKTATAGRVAFVWFAGTNIAGLCRSATTGWRRCAGAGP